MIRDSKRRWLTLGVMAVLAVGLVACGGEGESEPASVTSTPSVDISLPPTPDSRPNEATATIALPTATIMVEPAPSASPSPVVAAVAITDDQLIAIAEAAFPGINAEAFSGCDHVGSECPLTERLQQLVDSPGIHLCRCINGSTSRVSEPLPGRLEDGGGIVRVTMWEGNTSFDLVVVRSNDAWLVDDLYCAGEPARSIHAMSGPC